MLQNVLANLFSRPATRQYPFQRREPFEEARGRINFDIDKCVFCGACAKRCPAAAIEVNRAEKELKFQPFRCIICNACVEVCPRHCIDSVVQYRSPVYDKPEETYRGVVEAKAESKLDS
jgi:formate hydrogenlyase subunit 6/NADH:ubiquinone oxidoreductase subunit I